MNQTSTVLEGFRSWDSTPDNVVNWAVPVPISIQSRAGLAFDLVAIDKVAESIRDLRALQDDWDGYGAIPIMPNAVSTSLGFLTAISSFGQSMNLPAVVPNPNGTVSMEWEEADGDAYVELGETKASAFVRRHNHPTFYVHGAVNEVVSWLPALIAFAFSRPSTSNMNEATHIDFNPSGAG